MGAQDEVAELQRQIERLSIFHEVGKALFSTLDLQKILQTIMEKISDLLQPDTWSLLMVDEQAQELYFEIAIGHGAEKLREVRLKPGEGIAGWVAEHGEPVLVKDVRRERRFTPRSDELTQLDARSVLCVPIKGRERLLGVIETRELPWEAQFLGRARTHFREPRRLRSHRARKCAVRATHPRAHHFR